MTSSESWTDIVCKSLENVDKIYGKVVGTTPPLSEDEPICIVYKILPCADLIVRDPVCIELIVTKSFPGVAPTILARDPFMFSDHGINIQDQTVSIEWMDNTKYPLSVWVFAVRSLFLSPNVIPWTTPVHMRPQFSITDDYFLTTTLIGGTAGIRGKRPYMEDMDFSFPLINVQDKYNVTMFGILDGHGGQECAKFVADDLPTNVISNLRNGCDCAESLFRGYLTTDEDFLRDTHNKAGCTATVMLFDHSCGVISVANTGDTRAVVSRLHTAVDITRDMKATDPMEVARIVKSGGHIANGRVLGSLAIARAIGDKNLKKSPTKSLIPDPEVTSFSTTPDDEFIVIATDGLWDVMSSQAVVDRVNELLAASTIFAGGVVSGSENICNDRELGRIAEDIANHACNVLDSQDNITVTIIMLNHRPAASGLIPGVSAISRYVTGREMTTGPFKGYERKPSGQLEREIEYGLPKAPSGNYSSVSSVVTTMASAPVRASVAAVTSATDDDLMDFLMDDSNF